VDRHSRATGVGGAHAGADRARDRDLPTPPGAQPTIYPGAVLVPRILLVPLLAAALLAGCGGGDDGGPQTKAGFIAAADRVCADLSTDIAEAGSSNPQTPPQIAEANDVLADIYGKLADKISDVPLPAAGAARTGAQAFVSSIRAADPLVEKLRSTSDRFVAAAKAKDKAAITASGTALRSELDAFRAARADSDLQAIAYGMEICGSLG
jgi:hypothetical protein